MFSVVLSSVDFNDDITEECLIILRHAQFDGEVLTNLISNCLD